MNFYLCRNFFETMKKWILFLMMIFSVHGFRAFGQTITSRDNRAWLGYITQSRISNRLSIWADAHWVSRSFGILRPGLSYHFNNKYNVVTTLGYAHLWIYPAAGNKTFRPEHRLWGQTTASHKYNHFNFSHRLRYDARFRQKLIADKLQDEFNFNYRLRYQFQTKYNLTQQLSAKQKFYGFFADEVLYNVGKEIKNGNRLDQNRLSLGAGVSVRHTAVQLGYLNQLVKSATANTFAMNHHVQLFVLQNFDLRKKHP